MSAEGRFALLWGKILRSSIWLETKETRLLWITLLALKDKDGVVLGSVGGLAHTARISEEECAVAIEKFLAPDPDSGNPENEGRRVVKVPGGWKILNHEAYQFSTEARRLKWAEQKRIQRAAAEARKAVQDQKKKTSPKPPFAKRANDNNGPEPDVSFDDLPRRTP